MPQTYAPTTALVVVDVQNDFGDPRGGLYVPGGEHVVAAANAEIEAATAVGAPVFYTQDWHPETTPHFTVNAPPGATGTWPVHCVQGTWGAALHPDLLVRGEVVRKGEHGEDGYSGFTMRDPETGDSVPTPLARLLRDAGAQQLVVLGLAGDYCVLATALEGAQLGWPVTVPWQAVASVDLKPGDADRAREQLRAAGVVVTAGG